MNTRPVTRIASALVALAGTAAAQGLRLESGSLSLEFEETGGSLVAVRRDGREIARSPAAGATSVTFGFGPTNRVTWLEQLGQPRRLVGHARPSPETIELNVAAGPFEWIERYAVRDGGRRLDRAADLTWRGTHEVALRGFAFLLRGVAAPSGGACFFPAAWPPARYTFDELREGVKRRGRGTLAAAVAEFDPEHSAVWASFADDPPSVEVQGGKEGLLVRQGLNAAGRMRPGITQRLGPVTMLFVDGDASAALRRLQAWAGESGLRLPRDHAAWLGESVLYSFHPGGTIGSGFRDLGGFADAGRVVPPRMARLGADAAWILPVEQKSPYWPMDYYRFMDGLGTSNEYRRLVDRLHAGGVRVLQDLVPHGGAPQAVHNQAHPEFMLRREDGTTLNYWLNDFARPDWQAYVAAVARHYARGYGVDGYRVDACFGSKENNWSPDLPYARASLATMHGGLGMLEAIRGALKAERPDGALLAEVESERHQAYSDATYDFTFGLRVCRDVRELDPAEFVARLKTFLEQQRFVIPPGAARLRFIESHDTTRAQGWYGVEGLHTMYALSAWIDGIPMIYQGMDTGHGPALAAINSVRRQRSEMRAVDADLRFPPCDCPGVFAATRSKDGESTTFAINFGRDPVRTTIRDRLTGAEVVLRPFGYAVVEKAGPAPDPAVAMGAVETLGDEVRFDGATEWFVDTAEGRLHDWFDPVTVVAPARGGSGSIYWRPQGRGDLWQNELAPLYPAGARIGVRGADGRWRGFDFAGAAATNVLRLCDQSGGKAGLTLLGAGGLTARTWSAAELPAEPDVTRAADLGGATLRVVGPDYIVSNRHFTAVLRRTGGVLRELRTAAGERLAAGQDLYGDQAYFETRESGRATASSEGETGIRTWAAPDGLHLSFEGHLRGEHRFALKRPALLFRNEYVFGSGPSFAQRWSFRTEKAIRGVAVFLACNLREVAGDAFRFERGGSETARGPLGPGGTGRKGLAAGAPPDTMRFERGGQALWSLRTVRSPDGVPVRAFVVGRMPFLTLLDGPGAALEEDRWYDFGWEWHTEP